jgi:hypothetical protein
LRIKEKETCLTLQKHDGDDDDDDIYEDSVRTSQRTQSIFLDRHIGCDCLRKKTDNENVTLRGARKTAVAVEKK